MSEARARDAYAQPMPIVTQCTVPGCSTLTIGPLCLEHDVRTVPVDRRRPVGSASPVTAASAG